MYKVAYAKVNNAGDLLNEYIMRNVFGIEIECASCFRAQVSGIGSSLGNFQISDDPKTRILQIIWPKQVTHIWGTGFISHEKEGEKKFYNPNLVFDAVRGNLSKERAERLLGRKLDIPVCDGGILTSLMFEKGVEKKYELGIIPHYKEQDEPVFQALLKQSKNSTIIDLKADPMKVYEQIGSCEYIMSSSLHGLIMADSFGVPNLHVKATNKMLGDGFKFEDYYSGFGLKDNFYNLNNGNDLPTINDIIDRYKITPEMVDLKQKQMIECFPYKK